MNPHFEVQDVGDKVVDSALVISEVQIVQTKHFHPASKGTATSDVSIVTQLGRIVNIKIANKESTVITVVVKDNRPLGKMKQAIILPEDEVTFPMVCFGLELVDWDPSIEPSSEVSVSYKLESMWVKGMPPNPCPCCDPPLPPPIDSCCRDLNPTGGSKLDEWLTHACTLEDKALSPGYSHKKTVTSF